MSTYTVTIPVVVTVEADSEERAIQKASFTIGHGVHYVYGGEWITRLEDQATAAASDDRQLSLVLSDETDRLAAGWGITASEFLDAVETVKGAS